MKTTLSLGKLALFTSFAFACLASYAQAQTFLIDLPESTANEYTGNGTTDFGLPPGYTVVGGSTNGLTAGETFSFGGATLTVGAFPTHTGVSSTNPGVQTSPFRVTAQGFYTEPTAGGPVTFTLTGLTAGDLISISGIGNDSPNHGTPGALTVIDSTTSATEGSTTVPLPNDSTGAGTFGAPITFVATSDTYTIDFAATTGEGELGSLEIAETAVPEPSTYALVGIGLLGFVVMLRKRAAGAV